MGMPVQVACAAAVQWFRNQQIAPPSDIVEWLSAVPQADWRPAQVH